MRSLSPALISCGLIWATAIVGSAEAAVSWDEVLEQPDEWFASAEAQAIAENILLYQDPSGGWPKNHDMTKPPATTAGSRRDTTTPTIDNGATWTQVRFLARAHQYLPETRYAEAVRRGIDYLLEAQYPNGGWPQYYPLRSGYHLHVTFNDDAMVGVLELLRDVAKPEPEFVFIEVERRQRAAEAVTRGIDCILRCQIVVDGVRTAWCAQHDATTLAPAPARTFEPAALSGQESIGITRFLMSVEAPSPEIAAAVEAAIAWFAQTKISGIRISRPAAPHLPEGRDREVVADPDAPPLWARFYEIGTNRPIFSGRDGVIRYELREIEPERRGGYSWYTEQPIKLLERDYPRWRARHFAQ